MSGMTVDSTPFEDIRHLVTTMPGPKVDARDDVQAQLDSFIPELTPFGVYGPAAQPKLLMVKILLRVRSRVLLA